MVYHFTYTVVAKILKMIKCPLFFQLNIAVCILLLFVVLLMQQHQQQLVSLQQHKQQLEKHKKELEDLSMLSLFPKFLYKAGDVWNPTTQAFPPPAGTPMTSTSTLINLAQHKKQASSTKKQERMTGVPSSQPIQQHLMQVSDRKCHNESNVFHKTHGTHCFTMCPTHHKSIPSTVRCWVAILCFSVINNFVFVTFRFQVFHSFIISEQKAPDKFSLLIL